MEYEPNPYTDDTQFGAFATWMSENPIIVGLGLFLGWMVLIGPPKGMAISPTLSNPLRKRNRGKGAGKGHFLTAFKGRRG